MANRNLNLDIDAILDKHFNTDFKGYSPIEVDQFLDSVIRDYETYEQMLEETTDKIARIEDENATLKAKVAEVEDKLKKAEENTAQINTAVTGNLSQVDILRRIARLEQEIFNKK